MGKFSKTALTESSANSNNSFGSDKLSSYILSEQRGKIFFFSRLRLNQYLMGKLYGVHRQ